MSELSDLHSAAMDLASRAMIARQSEDHTMALVLFRQAFEKEKQAALSYLSNQSSEPSRSVLLRSAASLALECREYREAERLIGAALAGNPPLELLEELREIYEA